ncbi:hypothetical protein [Neolewinella agarilytica]|uniref:Uncharacterized protein n=1 Tax=Neolewinella agarilytica TaxID=478744 RepID=A0A1H9FA20_9BACT|nr:hypothetical protein [Neolewinella agarilytica]SEQ34780.1 hypothetical protein SAMN05444359_108149 [Neolewinella agarilytica]
MHQFISRLDNGRCFPSMPFFAAIKDISCLPDEAVLEQCGLLNVQKNGNESTILNTVFICRNNEWSIIIDNWGYTLYHFMMHQRRHNKLAQIDSFGGENEMFQGVFGDSDESFSFYYFKNGQNLRTLEVSDPYYKGPELSADQGAPLPGEPEYFNLHKDIITIVNIAYELGIQFPENLDEYREYRYDLPPVSEN